MNKMRYETGKAPNVLIEECSGDLVVKSWSEAAVLVKGEHEAKQLEDGLNLTSQSSIIVMVPEQANLSIGTAASSLVVKNVGGEVNLEEAMGDLALANLGPTTVQSAHANLAAKNIDGAFSAQTVYGDAVVRNAEDVTLNDVHGNLVTRNINGSLSINEVYGDLNMRNINGDVGVQLVRGNARVKNVNGQVMMERVQGDLRVIGPLSEGKHALSAAGNLTFYWPANTPLNLEATAAQIINRLPLEDVVQDGKSLSGRIGEGSTAVTLQAQGELRLKETAEDYEWGVMFGGDAHDFDFNFDFDFEGIGERIRAEMDSHVARITGDLEQRFGPDFAQRIAEKVSREAERAAARAEREAERAAARAERAAERAQREAERHAERFARTGFRHGGRHVPPVPPVPPQSPVREVSAEEQLKILRMVENGTISPEEANMLLKALEKA